jgi:hypothetical protein
MSASDDPWALSDSDGEATSASNLGGEPNTLDDTWAVSDESSDGEEISARSLVVGSKRSKPGRGRPKGLFGNPEERAHLRSRRQLARPDQSGALVKEEQASAQSSPSSLSSRVLTMLRPLGSAIHRFISSNVAEAKEDLHTQQHREYTSSRIVMVVIISFICCIDIVVLQVS